MGPFMRILNMQRKIRQSKCQKHSETIHQGAGLHQHQMTSSHFLRMGHQNWVAKLAVRFLNAVRIPTLVQYLVSFMDTIIPTNIYNNNISSRPTEKWSTIGDTHNINFQNENSIKMQRIIKF